MADDPEDTYERVYADWKQSQDAFMHTLGELKNELRPYAENDEQLEQMIRWAWVREYDPEAFEEGAARIQNAARIHEDIRREKVEKLQQAYRNFEGLPDTTETYNCKIALQAMLRRYGAKP
jgi:hypothetical protein